MGSFTKKLIINFTGVILIGFLVVYFLFNALVENHIREEARRELSDGINYIADRSYRLQVNRRIFGEILSPEEEFENLQIQLEQIHAFRPVRHSFIDTEVIIINEYDEIISPWLNLLPEAQATEIKFLANYYVANRTRLREEEMVMIMAEAGTYYMQAVSRVINNTRVSILSYTDITSAIAFKDNMNQILLVLLIVSAALSLAISVIMSAKFKKAAAGLSRYAETIGLGNFTAKAETYKDSEFDKISKSMTNMSNMLAAYESNQKQFFQNVSHELRSPLMFIQGYAEGIVENVFDKDEAAHIILSESEKMTELVSGLLYISRIDSGLETPDNIEPVDVIDLIKYCCERVKIIAEKSNKQLSFDMPDSVTMNTDKEKFSRAFINVLSNAVRHAEREIKIICKTSDANVEIIVQDDGKGIASKDLPHIFERFYKGENGNSGIGLSISKNIITSLCGRVYAENLPPPNHGARFVISFPND